MSPADAQAGTGTDAPAGAGPDAAASAKQDAAVSVEPDVATSAELDIAADPESDAAAGSRVRPRRADAQRNRDLLLAAAKDIFTERGIDAPLDDIARRAGVGNATMYRHFPTRSDLIVAVYADEVADLCARGQELAATHGPREALFSWLADFIAHVASKKELALAIADDRAGTRSTLFGQWHAAMHATATTLLTRAQHIAAVRADLDVADLLSLANGIALSGASPNRLERLLTLVREGVETGPSR